MLTTKRGSIAACLTCLALFAEAVIYTQPATAAPQSAEAATSAASTPSLVSIQVAGANTINLGQPAQLTAIGTYSDQSTRDITSSVTWSALETTVGNVKSGALSTAQPGFLSAIASVGTVQGASTVPVMGKKMVQIYPSMSQSQIQSVINSSAAGDILYFNAGNYYLTASPVIGLNFLPGRTYVGSVNGAATLVGTGGYALVTFSGTNAVIQNLVFNGGGIHFAGAISGVDVEWNTFTNVDAGWVNETTSNAIFMDTSAANCDFSHNKFTNIGASVLGKFQDSVNAGGMLGYGLSNVTIEYNTFDTYDEGIHIFYDRLDGNNVKINYNTFTKGHRIAIEQQDAKAAGLEIAHNTVSNPLNAWALTYALSIATVSSTGVSVHDNLLNGNAPIAPACTGSGCHYGYGIEAAGNGTQVYNNVVEGGWINGVAIGGANNLKVINNVLCGPTMAKNNNYVVYESQPQPGTVIQGNLQSAQATCENPQ